MAEVTLFDKIAISDAQVRITDDGYLVASPRVARVGIQDYLGREVGSDKQIVRVFRPAEEVFSADAMHSFAYRPITNDHPPEHVKANNWKKYAVGHAGGEVVRDGDFMRVPLVMMDAQAISDVQNGKAELSAGYRCVLDWTPGEYNGEHYDAVQRSIRANHIAVVSQARGGDKLKIGDQESNDTLNPNGKQEKSAMNDKTMTIIDVDGVKVTMDETSAAIVNRHIRSLSDKLEAVTTTSNKALADAKADIEKLNKENEELKKEKEQADAKIVTLEKQVKDAEVTPDKLDAMVKDRAEVVGKAKAIIGDKLVVDGKSVIDIKRQVVDAHLGDAAKDWSDDKVVASFDTITANVKSDDGVKRMRDAFSGRAQNSNSDRKAVYDGYDKNLSDAWKMQAGK